MALDNVFLEAITGFNALNFFFLAITCNTAPINYPGKAKSKKNPGTKMAPGIIRIT